MENSKSNKKLIICACIAVIAIIAIIIAVVVSKSAYKKQIKGLAEAMQDSDKMEKFIDKEVNLRAWYALNSLDKDEDLDKEDEKAVKKAFEKAYKDAKKSDYEGDENKDTVKMYFGFLSLYTASVGKDAKVEVKDIKKLEKADEYEFMQQADFTMKISAGDEKNETKWRALFYKGKIVMAAPVDEDSDSSNSNFDIDDDEYDFDDDDYNFDEDDYEEEDEEEYDFDSEEDDDDFDLEEDEEDIDSEEDEE